MKKQVIERVVVDRKKLEKIVKDLEGKESEVEEEKWYRTLEVSSP